MAYFTFVNERVDELAPSERADRHRKDRFRPMSENEISAQFRAHNLLLAQRAPEA